MCTLKRFQPGEGPRRGLLCVYETSSKVCCTLLALEFMPEPWSPIRCRIVEFFHDVDRLGLRRRRQLMKKLENWFLDPWDFLIESGVWEGEK